MLAIQKSPDQDLMLLQTQWIKQLNPLLTNPSNNVSILKNVALISGTNTINHLLGKPLTGWRLVRIRAAATIYDLQDSNTMPALTLILHSSANASVDIEVF